MSVRKMIEKIEKLAAYLIPLRKKLLLGFVISLFGGMTVGGGLMILFKNPVFFILGIFLSIMGFAWFWGLFLISFWYNPDGGPLTLQKIETMPALFKLHARIMRYTAPAFLVIWFSSPFIILAIQMTLIHTIIQK